MQNTLLKDKVALITGGSRGIGKAIAQTFLNAGARVVITYIQPSQAVTDFEATCNKDQVVLKALRADVSQREAAQEVVAATIKEFGKIDICVSNAGISKDNLLPRISEEQWNTTLATNLSGVFHITQAVISPMMRARTGSIINLSSIVGLRGNIGQTAYAASKSGIIGLSKSVALEYAGRNVRCNVIAPGFVATDMTSYLTESNKSDEYLTKIPLKRYGKPEDIAQTALFLASDLSSYITGQVISVCGGMNI